MAATGSFCAKHAERKAPADDPIKLSGWVRFLKNSPKIYLSKPNKVNHLGPPLAPKKEVKSSGLIGVHYLA